MGQALAKVGLGDLVTPTVTVESRAGSPDIAIATSQPNSPGGLARRRTTAVLVSPDKSASWPSNLDHVYADRRMSAWRGGSAAHGGIGILVHGCHLQADGWESIVWGEPPEQLGRLPHAALLAWEERASLACLCFGTGASQAADGTLEGEYTLRTLRARVGQLSEFSAFDGVPLDELAALLQSVCVAETVSQNTVQEVREGLTRFALAGCKRAVLVSSPTHLPRCLACACAVEEADPNLFDGSVWASPCDTSYKGYDARDVVVVEPPHRGDRDKQLDELPFHLMVKRSFGVQGGRREQFLRDFEALLKTYGV